MAPLPLACTPAATTARQPCAIIVQLEWRAGGIIVVRWWFVDPRSIGTVLRQRQRQSGSVLHPWPRQPSVGEEPLSFSESDKLGVLVIRALLLGGQSPAIAAPAKRFSSVHGCLCGLRWLSGAGISFQVAPAHEPCAAGPPCSAQLRSTCKRTA